MSVIEVNNIAKKYGRRHILSAASFYANQGECIGIVGANGCGKSTLMGILAGCVKPNAGDIRYFNVYPLKQHKEFAEKVGYVPQENPLMDKLTVKDNLKFWYCDSNRNLEADLTDGIAAQMGLTPYANTLVEKLSGGLKKRLSIVCAMANNPPIVILDEPGASLDIVCKQDIVSYFRSYMNNGGTVILTSHEEYELSMCTRMYIIADGKLQELDGIPDSEQLMELIREKDGI